VVAAVTAQVRPSIIIVYFVVSVTKLVPVKVTESPPVTVPYLGDIEESSAVFAPSYVTVYERVCTTVLSFSTAIGHAIEVAELSTVSTPAIFISPIRHPFLSLL
jgi:hypothetical protein